MKSSEAKRYLQRPSFRPAHAWEQGIEERDVARGSKAIGFEGEEVMRGYPAKFQRAKEGGFTVTFRDVPEAITEGDTVEEAQSAAADALETALSFYVDERRPLPKPSTLKRGERLVQLSAIGMAKTALYEAMLAEKVSRAELARRLSCHLEQVARLLDLTHASKFEQLQRALEAVNRRMIVITEAA